MQCNAHTVIVDVNVVFVVGITYPSGIFSQPIPRIGSYKSSLTQQHKCKHLGNNSHHNEALSITRQHLLTALSELFKILKATF